MSSQQYVECKYILNITKKVATKKQQKKKKENYVTVLTRQSSFYFFFFRIHITTVDIIFLKKTVPSITFFSNTLCTF